MISRAHVAKVKQLNAKQKIARAETKAGAAATATLVEKILFGKEKGAK